MIPAVRTLAILFVLPLALAMTIVTLPGTTPDWAIGLLLAGYVAAVATTMATSGWTIPVKVGGTMAHLVLSVPAVLFFAIMQACLKGNCS